MVENAEQFENSGIKVGDRIYDPTLGAWLEWTPTGWLDITRWIAPAPSLRSKPSDILDDGISFG